MTKRHAAVAGLLVLLTLGMQASAPGQVRRSAPGIAIEPFTLPRAGGAPFDYRPGRPAVIAFVAAHQKRSERAVGDLDALAVRMQRLGHDVDLLLVVSGGEGVAALSARWGTLESGPTILDDADDRLWSRQGVMVTPTTFIVDRRGVIAWVRAGHSFDFAHAARAVLNRILGLAEEVPGPGASATTETEDDPDARAARHARIGRILARKGDVPGGIVELGRARTITPDSIEIRLELARLLCRASRPEEALAEAQSVDAATTAERALAMTVMGWAHRQLGDLDRATSLLVEAITLDPGSTRAHYELGKIHEQRGECTLAAAAYRRALSIRFDDPAEE